MSTAKTSVVSLSALFILSCISTDPPPAKEDRGRQDTTQNIPEYYPSNTTQKEKDSSNNERIKNSKKNYPNCNSEYECANTNCNDYTCLQQSCKDGVQNNLESDVDCGGGLCPDCSNGKKCRQNKDCKSKVCTKRKCQQATCDDGTLNGTETDIDCGGSCSACGAEKTCKLNLDCDSGVCQNNLCQSPTCRDGVQNQGETAVDCGGDNCSNTLIRAKPWRKNPANALTCGPKWGPAKGWAITQDDPIKQPIQLAGLKIASCLYLESECPTGELNIKFRWKNALAICSSHQYASNTPPKIAVFYYQRVWKLALKGKTYKVSTEKNILLPKADKFLLCKQKLPESELLYITDKSVQ